MPGAIRVNGWRCVAAFLDAFEVELKLSLLGWTVSQCDRRAVEFLLFTILVEALFFVYSHNANSELFVNHVIRIEGTAHEIIFSDEEVDGGFVFLERRAVRKKVGLSPGCSLSVNETIGPAHDIDTVYIIAILRKLPRHELVELKAGEQAAKTKQAFAETLPFSLDARHHIAQALDAEEI